jgi:thymidylate kinase
LGEQITHIEIKIGDSTKNLKDLDKEQLEMAIESIITNIYLLKLRIDGIDNAIGILNANKEEQNEHLEMAEKIDKEYKEIIHDLQTRFFVIKTSEENNEVKKKSTEKKGNK